LPEPKRGASGSLAADSPQREGPDAQELARRQRIDPSEGVVLEEDPRRMNLLGATRYVLRIRTNVILILASACGYYFLAGVQTFGVEFMSRQYGIAQALAGLPLLVVGAAVGDTLLRHGYLNSRILVSAVAVTAAAILFVPPVFTRSALTTVPYLAAAAMFLSAQNPPIDAARLDIVVPRLWGRAEAVRTVLRAAAQALAPLIFGAVSDHVFGGGRGGLQWTFLVMLLPLAGSAVFLFRGLATYPTDVAAAAASKA